MAIRCVLKAVSKFDYAAEKEQDSASLKSIRNLFFIKCFSIMVGFYFLGRAP